MICLGIPKSRTATIHSPLGSQTLSSACSQSNSRAIQRMAIVSPSSTQPAPIGRTSTISFQRICSSATALRSGNTTAYLTSVSSSFGRISLSAAKSLWITWGSFVTSNPSTKCCAVTYSHYNDSGIWDHNVRRGFKRFQNDRVKLI